MRDAPLSLHTRKNCEIFTVMDADGQLDGDPAFAVPAMSAEVPRSWARWGCCGFQSFSISNIPPIGSDISLMHIFPPGLLCRFKYCTIDRCNPVAAALVIQ